MFYSAQQNKSPAILNNMTPEPNSYLRENYRSQQPNFGKTSSPLVVLAENNIELMKRMNTPSIISNPRELV